MFMWEAEDVRELVHLIYACAIIMSRALDVCVGGCTCTVCMVTDRIKIGK